MIGLKKRCVWGWFVHWWTGCVLCRRCTCRSSPSSARCSTPSSWYVSYLPNSFPKLQNPARLFFYFPLPRPPTFLTLQTLFCFWILITIAIFFCLTFLFAVKLNMQIIGVLEKFLLSLEKKGFFLFGF